ncbi:MAG: hypothetical protein M3N16_04830 [Actinomycetota bacterium]|nr:hypothetical protein [Actinomycetota bacterium]
MTALVTAAMAVFSAAPAAAESSSTGCPDGYDVYVLNPLTNSDDAVLAGVDLNLDGNLCVVVLNERAFLVDNSTLAALLEAGLPGLDWLIEVDPDMCSEVDQRGNRNNNCAIVGTQNNGGQYLTLRNIGRVHVSADDVLGSL